MTDKTLSFLDDFPPVTYEQWRQVVDGDLKGAPFEKKLVTRTYEGIDIQPIYTRADWPGEGDPGGMPGLPLFVRGDAPLGRAAHGWDICQIQSHPDPVGANEQVLTDLAGGVTSIALRLDEAARAGVAPDAADPRVGAGGVAVTGLADLAQVFAGVHLEMIGIHAEPGGQFLAAAALLESLWDQQRIADDQRRGSFGADPLGTLASSGHLPVALDDSLGQMAELAAWADQKRPKVRAVTVDSSAYHHAGATAVQDLAFSMATALAYLRALTSAGLSAEQAAGQIGFAYSVGCNQFLAIAKLRAARRLWARIVEACGGGERARGMDMHVRTAERVMTGDDPWVNMLRTTVGCFAAATAGANRVTVLPFDAAIGLPGELSRRVARNTQLILQEESHLNRVVDPAGGCWYVERLTDELAERAWTLMQQVEAAGGMAAYLTTGKAAAEIDEAYAPRLKNISRRKDAITGVSEFPNITETPPQTEQPDIAAVRKQAVERALNAQADADAVAAVAAAAPGQRLAPAVQAAAAGATFSQIARALAGEGEPATAAPLTPRRYAEPYEALRDAADAHAQAHGQRPRVFLANLGPVAEHTARATYSRNFFEAGGFEAVTNKGFASADEAAKALADSGAKIAVICSSDKRYPEAVPELAPALKQAGAQTVILAGHPGDKQAEYQAAGVDRFIHIGCDVLGTLQQLHMEQGLTR